MNVRENEIREKIDPALTGDNLSALIGAVQGPIGSDSDIRGYDILSGGCWNRVIAVDTVAGDLICKISPTENDEKLIREYRVLQIFAEKTDLKVPIPLYLDQGELLPGTTLVMTRLPGEVMHECFGYLDETSRRHITEKIGRDLGTLHTHRVVGFGGLELSPEDRYSRWSDFWIPRLNAVLDEAEDSGYVPMSLVEGARELQTAFPELLDIGPHGSFTHYDVWSGNVMIDTSCRPARVSGYIDIPGFYADYARDLSFAILFGVADQHFFKAYRELRDLDDRLPVRVSIYNLKMNIRHAQMYPGEAWYRQGAEECLKSIRSYLKSE